MSDAAGGIELGVQAYDVKREAMTDAMTRPANLFMHLERDFRLYPGIDMTSLPDQVDPDMIKVLSHFCEGAASRNDSTLTGDKLDEATIRLGPYVTMGIETATIQSPQERQNFLQAVRNVKKQGNGVSEIKWQSADGEERSLRIPVSTSAHYESLVAGVVLADLLVAERDIQTSTTIPPQEWKKELEAMVRFGEQNEDPNYTPQRVCDRMLALLTGFNQPDRTYMPKRIEDLSKWKYQPNAPAPHTLLSNTFYSPPPPSGGNIPKPRTWR